MKTKDALIELSEEMGGELLGRLGSDIASRRFYRRQGIGRSTGESSDLLRRGIDKARSVLEFAQNFSAATDLINRLPEGKAAARRLGYTYEGNQWFREGKPVNRLPEYVRVRIINAMADATTDFKISGRKGQQINSISPFFNAAIQGTARDLKQLATIIKALKSGKATTETQKQAKDLAARWAMRLAVNSMAMSVMGYLWGQWRAEDDDYEEMTAFNKDAAFSGGEGLTTDRRVPKGRSLPQTLFNLFESIGAAKPGDEAAAAARAMGRDAENRLPSVGAGFVQAAWQVAMNEDHTGRPIESRSDIFQNTPKELRERSGITDFDRLLGRYLGPIGLSPAQINHLLNSASGGAYYRWANLARNATNGALTKEDVPFFGRLFAERTNTQSVSDFYTAINDANRRHKINQVDGVVDENTDRTRRRLEDYEELMTSIRAMDSRDLSGRRSKKFEGYLVGLAREALGREPLDSAPSPFAAPDLPKEVAKVVYDFASRKADTGMLLQGRPEKVHAGDSSYAETYAKWQAGVQEANRWLADHRDSPQVKRAIVDALGKAMAKRK